ncbi:MAG TPA: hypothetical protein VFZ76_14645 [Anaerolineales bacterium]
MKIQALARPLPVCNLFVVNPSKQPRPSRPIRVSRQDLGYEIDENDLARELQAQLSDSFEDQAIPEIDPDQFESIYCWFLS